MRIRDREALPVRAEVLGECPGLLGADEKLAPVDGLDGAERENLLRRVPTDEPGAVLRRLELRLQCDEERCFLFGQLTISFGGSGAGGGAGGLNVCGLTAGSEMP